MQCMKCGREIDGEQVFCDNCLSIMEKYPIKPSTHIHLPKRELPTVKVSRKKVLSPEEQVPVDESEYSGTDKHPARLKATAAVKTIETNLKHFLCIKKSLQVRLPKGNYK